MIAPEISFAVDIMRLPYSSLSLTKPILADGADKFLSAIVAGDFEVDQNNSVCPSLAVLND